MSQKRTGLAVSRIFLVTPLCPSVENALPLLLGQMAGYEISVKNLSELDPNQWDPTGLTLYVFSLVTTQNRKLLKSFFEKINPFAGARILLISEEKAGAAAVSWRQLHVHEYILGPLVAPALLMKVQRHLQKLSEVPIEVLETHKKLEEDQSKNIEPISPNLAKNVNMPKVFNVHGIALGPNTFLFPREKDDEIEKVTIECDIPAIHPSAGKWKQSEQDAEEWSWIVSRGGTVGQDEDDSGFRFLGEKPQFDEEKKTWVFTGKTPELYSKSKDTNEQDPMVFGFYSKQGLVMYKTTPNMDQSKVWFVRRTDFSNSALQFSQKKDESSQKGPGGVSEAKDSALLDALDQALGKRKAAMEANGKKKKSDK